MHINISRWSRICLFGIKSHNYWVQWRKEVIHVELQKVKTKSRIFQIEIWTGAKTKKRYGTEYFSGMVSSLTTETWHDTAILVQVNCSLCKPYRSAYHMKKLWKGGFERPKVVKWGPLRSGVKTNDLWIYRVYSCFSFILPCRQPAIPTVLQFAKSFPFQVLLPLTYWFIQLFFIGHQLFARHCSRCWGYNNEQGRQWPCLHEDK